MLKELFLCLFLFNCALAEDIQERGSEEPIVANLNEYIDNILPAIVNFMINNGLDPMTLPDQHSELSVRPLFITYRGELDISNGVLVNMKSLKRSGDTVVSYWNKILRVKIDFGVQDVKFNYDYLAKIMGMGPTGGIVGKLKKMSIFTEILIDFNNFELQLQDFYFHDVGKITVKLTGNILMDLVSNSIIDVVTTLFKGPILNAIEDQIRNTIQTKIDEINESMKSKSLRVKDPFFMLGHNN